MSDFITFNVNGVSNFLYMLTGNLWFLLLLIGVVGSIILRLKEEIDTAIRDEQNII